MSLIAHKLRYQVETGNNITGSSRALPQNTLIIFSPLRNSASVNAALNLPLVMCEEVDTF